MPAAAHPIAVRALLGRFTSLGDNCEFGLAQRRAGAEPLGLFRLASCSLDGLLAGLADGFADLDPPTRLDVVQPWGDEFITYFGVRGFYHHTLMGSADANAASLRVAEATRVPFLRRRLLDELADGDTIFVRKSDQPDPAGMAALHQALRAHNQANRLLWVEQAPGGEGATVQRVAPGLYRGWLDRFAPYGDAVALDFDGWVRLCAGVLALEGETLPPAGVPPAARIGLDVPMGGWDGVSCTPGGPPPLRPGGQVFAHATDIARQCCGAVLNPRPALTAGESYVASVYVWLPADFAGSLIAPVLTHVDRAQRLYAVLQDRERWQRLWAAAVIPPDLPGVDFALWLNLDAGDQFYTTEWSLSPGTSPGDYLLEEARPRGRCPPGPPAGVKTPDPDPLEFQPPAGAEGTNGSGSGVYTPAGGPGGQRPLGLAVLLIAAGILLVAGLTAWIGLRTTLAAVGQGASALPAALAVHAIQLLLAGLAWGALLPVWLSPWQLFRARWLREAVNSILPTASLGGAFVGARLLTRSGRIDVATAGAAGAADITGEAIAQILFLCCGLALAASLPHAPLSPLWAAAALAPPLLIVTALVAAQALGLAGWLEHTAARLLPPRLARPLIGLQASLAAIYRRRGRLTADIALNFAGWSLGSLEVWLLLHPLHQTVSWQQATVIESLGVVARSIGFAVPAGLAAQETGFVLACALFGIPHQAGLALSLLKRARELLVGVAGVLYWQWLERGVWRRL